MAGRDAYLLAGPTASGKSAAAALLARETGAAILSADSMLVYKGMDVGTAKPPPGERAEFAMGGIDLVTPAEAFSSGAWLRAAAAWLRDLPPDRPVIVTGGTGLYFSALLRGLDRKWTRPPPAYPVLRADRAVLHARIAARLDDMFLRGLADEVASLRRRYPVWSRTAAAAIGYKEFIDGLPAAAVRDAILVRTRQLAKRQDTWFRHQATPLYVEAADDPAQTAAAVRRVWRAHGPWSIDIPDTVGRSPRDRREASDAS